MHQGLGFGSCHPNSLLPSLSAQGSSPGAVALSLEVRLRRDWLSDSEALAAFDCVFWTESPSICIDAAIVCIHDFKKGFPFLPAPFNIM